VNFKKLFAKESFTATQQGTEGATMYRIFSYLLIALLGVVVTSVQAAEKPVLTIYTYDAFAADWGPAPLIKKAFEGQCDCQLDFVATDSSIGILRKIQLEGAATKADIALGLDSNLTDVAGKTGLFAAHNADAGALALPIAWRDTTFLPFDYGYFAFVYNSEKVKAAPTSFEALAALPDDFKIVIQDPRSSTPGLGLLLWVKKTYGDKSAALWKRLAPKILTVTKGWSDAYSLFLKGEADMVLSYTTSPAYHLIAEKDARFKAAAFDEGHYMQVEVAAIVKSSKQQKLARQFMQFMLSADFQNVIPTTNWMYPAANTAGDLPKGFDTLHRPKTSLLMSGAEVGKNRKAWLGEWLAALNR
jgi:thiamine transport system substrate-binding protein